MRDTGWPRSGAIEPKGRQPTVAHGRSLIERVADDHAQELSRVEEREAGDAERARG